MMWLILDRGLFPSHVKSRIEQSKAGTLLSSALGFQGWFSQCYFQPVGKRKRGSKASSFILQQMTCKLHETLPLIIHWPDLGHKVLSMCKMGGKCMATSLAKTWGRGSSSKRWKRKTSVKQVKSFCHTLSTYYIYLYTTYCNLMAYRFTCLFLSPHTRIWAP